MPGRNYSSGDYRFGFNGMEMDNEMHGQTGSSYDFGARMYNSRLGRWSSVDPYFKKYVPISPYTMALNSPIKLKDADGNVVTGREQVAKAIESKDNIHFTIKPNVETEDADNGKKGLVLGSTSIPLTFTRVKDIITNIKRVEK